MQLTLTVAAALLGLAALVLTLLGARRASFRLGLGGGACFSLALTAALVLGLDTKYLLLSALLLLCAAQAGRKEKRP